MTFSKWFFFTFKLHDTSPWINFTYLDFWLSNFFFRLLLFETENYLKIKPQNFSLTAKIMQKYIFWFKVAWVSTPQCSAFHKILLLTITPHSHAKTFLKATILTTITMVFCHFTILVSPALISQLLSNGPFEEAFAAFTTYCSIMSA